MNFKKKSIEERVSLFKTYLRRENSRPLFGFSIGSEYPLFRYPFGLQLPENRALKPDDFNIPAFVEDCEKLFTMHEKCGGDFIYSEAAFWGIPWLEVALGCPIFADHNSGAIYCKPPKDFDFNSLPEFSEKNEWMVLLTEMLDALARKSNGRFPLATTRMRGITDLLSALHGGEGFIFAMLEYPEKMNKLCKNLTDYFIKCAKLQLTRIPDFHGGIGSFFYNAWCNPGTVWYQEDAAAILSPELYAEFIEPCDKRITRSFKHIAMHQHSTGFVPTDKYIAMGMDILEMHIDSGGPSAKELYDQHLKILKQKPLLIWGIISEKDLDWIFSKLPAEGLAVITLVESPEQAHLLWNKYMEGN